MICTIHYVIMNVTNRNQSLVKSEIRHYFIRLTICNRSIMFVEAWKSVFKFYFYTLHACILVFRGKQLYPNWIPYKENHAIFIKCQPCKSPIIEILWYFPCIQIRLVFVIVSSYNHLLCLCRNAAGALYFSKFKRGHYRGDNYCVMGVNFRRFWQK